MQTYINSSNSASEVKKSDLFVFFSNLIINKYSILLFLLFFCGLLSGHLTIPKSQEQYDEARGSDLDAISRYVASAMDSFEYVKEQGGEVTNEAERIKLYGEIKRRAEMVIQQYSTEAKYGLGDRSILDKNWYLMCDAIISGVRDGFIDTSSDLILQIGEINLVKSHLFNRGLVSMGVGNEQLRPRYDREQFLENVFGGVHLLSLLPFIVMVFLIHNSFSQDYETSTYKLLRTLPISNISSNTVKLLAYMIIPIVVMLGLIFLASLTYRSNADAMFIFNQGEFSSLFDYAKAELNPSDYIISANSYIGSLFLLYFLELFAVSAITIFLSKVSKNSFFSLTLPLTALLFLSAPNIVASKSPASKLPYSSFISGKYVLEKLAPLDIHSAILLFLGIGIILTILIIVPRHTFRKRFIHLVGSN
ncbi:MAG: hypothetical protein Q4P65_03400 [Eubacteriales bacterium]|nr:hypothetical protein [Eubacteriales bacterium]